MVSAALLLRALHNVEQDPAILEDVRRQLDEIPVEEHLQAEREQIDNSFRALDTQVAVIMALGEDHAGTIALCNTLLTGSATVDITPAWQSSGRAVHTVYRKSASGTPLQLRVVPIGLLQGEDARADLAAKQRYDMAKAIMASEPILRALGEEPHTDDILLDQRCRGAKPQRWALDDSPATDIEVQQNTVHNLAEHFEVIHPTISQACLYYMEVTASWFHLPDDTCLVQPAMLTTYDPVPFTLMYAQVDTFVHAHGNPLYRYSAFIDATAPRLAKVIEADTLVPHLQVHPPLCVQYVNDIDPLQAIATELSILWTSLHSVRLNCNSPLFCGQSAWTQRRWVKLIAANFDVLCPRGGVARLATRGKDIVRHAKRGPTMRLTRDICKLLSRMTEPTTAMHTHMKPSEFEDAFGKAVEIHWKLNNTTIEDELRQMLKGITSEDVVLQQLGVYGRTIIREFLVQLPCIIQGLYTQVSSTDYSNASPVVQSVVADDFLGFNLPSPMEEMVDWDLLLGTDNTAGPRETALAPTDWAGLDAIELSATPPGVHMDSPEAKRRRTDVMALLGESDTTTQAIARALTHEMAQASMTHDPTTYTYDENVAIRAGEEAGLLFALSYLYLDTSNETTDSMRICNKMYDHGVMIVLKESHAPEKLAKRLASHFHDCLKYISHQLLHAAAIRLHRSSSANTLMIPAIQERLDTRPVISVEHNIIPHPLALTHLQVQTPQSITTPVFSCTYVPSHEQTAVVTFTLEPAGTEEHMGCRINAIARQRLMQMKQFATIPVFVHVYNTRMNLDRQLTPVFNVCYFVVTTETLQPE